MNEGVALVTTTIAFETRGLNSAQFLIGKIAQPRNECINSTTPFPQVQLAFYTIANAAQRFRGSGVKIPWVYLACDGISTSGRNLSSTH